MVGSVPPCGGRNMWLRSQNPIPTVAARRRLPMQTRAGDSTTLLDSIAEFCRHVGMAESTFGRRAVSDGKFVSRLRDGARIMPETLERVALFMSRHGGAPPAAPPELLPLIRVVKPAAAAAPAAGESTRSRDFRFFDNR